MTCKSINPESAIFFRDQLRAGRATALRDAEGFQALLFVLERLGSYSDGSINGLGTYKTCIQTIASKSPLANEVPSEWAQYHLPFSKLYDLVQDARNDALHQGAFARHLTDHVVNLALVLEDALMNDAYTVSDFMVREPVCASLWQPISFVRQQMLANSFSYLPILLEKDGKRNWYFLSDTNIARFLKRTERKNKRRKELLATTVEDAIKSDENLVELAKCYPSDKAISDVLEHFKGHPILITDSENEHQLIGILTAFDLL